MRPEDDAYLDAWLDRALCARAEGRTLDLAEALAERPELERELARTLELAGLIAVVKAEQAPLFPGYELLSELGRGASGVVYLARQLELDRPVALKVLSPAIGAAPRGRARFRSEARSIAKLAHPHVVRVHEVLEHGGTLAFAMEWIDGGSLARVIEALGPQLRTATTRDVLALLGGTNDGSEEPYLVFACRTLVAIARAVHAAHEQGLVHRDLKPSNILLRRDGSALLADFGLVHDAELSLGTESGSFLGTAAYAAPEQLRAARGEAAAIDARSDVYALGATLFTALCGDAPTRARDPLGALHELERGTTSLRARRPDLPRELATIAEVAMELDPARRYATALDFAEDLERFLAFQPIRARPASLARRVAAKLRRHRQQLALATVVAVLSVAAAFTIGREWIRREELAAERAQRAIEAHRAARAELLDAQSGERAYIVAHAARPDAIDPRPRDLSPALRAYEEALSASSGEERLRREHALVESVQRGSAEREPLPADPFLRGLRAYLLGNHEECLREWQSLDLSEEPFVDAALGQLHLYRDAPALAYTRLRQAVGAYPEAGFLWIELADAAQQCGDIERALHWIERARAIGGLDPWDTDLRVEADALAKKGDHDAARARFDELRRTRIAPNARRRHALFLERVGELDTAAEVAWEAWQHGPQSPPFRVVVTRTNRRWWDALDHEARTACVALALRGDILLRERLLEVIPLLREIGDGAMDPPLDASPHGQRLPLGEQRFLEEFLAMFRSSFPPVSQRLSSMFASWPLTCESLPRRGFSRCLARAALFALISATVPAVVHGQVGRSFDFEFEAVPGLLPHQSRLLEVLHGGGGFPTPPWSIPTGFTSQTTIVTPGSGWGTSFFYAGYPGGSNPPTPVPFQPQFRSPMEIDVQLIVRGVQGNAGSSVVCYCQDPTFTVPDPNFGIAIGASSNPNQATIFAASSITPATVIATISLNTLVSIRINYTPIPPSYSVSINGVVQASGLQLGSSSPGSAFIFGDTAGLSGNNANIDWYHVRFYNGALPLPAGQGDSSAATVSLVLNGTRELTGVGPGPHAVPPPWLSSGGLFTLGIFGPPNASAALFLGTPSTAAGNFGCIGQLDLVPLVPPIALQLPASGVLYQGFGVLPPLAPGVLALQAAVIQPTASPCPVVLSSAKIL